MTWNGICMGNTSMPLIQVKKCGKEATQEESQKHEEHRQGNKVWLLFKSPSTNTGECQMQLTTTIFKTKRRRRWYFTQCLLHLQSFLPGESINAKRLHWIKERLEKFKGNKSFRVTKCTSDSGSLSWKQLESGEELLKRSICACPALL